MGKIFTYIAFGLEVATCIPAVIALLKVKPVSGSALLSAVQPALQGFTAAFGHTIPPLVEQDVANAIADVLNKA